MNGRGKANDGKRKHYGYAENEQADTFYGDSADAQPVYQFSV